MKRALIVAATGGFLNGFLIPDMKLLQEMGYEVHCAANGNSVSTFVPEKRFASIGVAFHQIDFSSTSPVSKESLTAYKQYKELLDRYHFDFVHVHTPIPGAIVRVATRRKRKEGCVVVYTTHGLTFPKGAPLKTKIVYGGVEWFCSWMTDGIITINKEDYSQMKKMACKNVYHINGVGVDTSRYHECQIDRDRYRESLGLSENDIAILEVGELSTRKNHKVIIEALSKINDKHYVFLICGKAMSNSGTYDFLKKYAEEKNVRVIFLGFRTIPGRYLMNRVKCRFHQVQKQPRWAMPTGLRVLKTVCAKWLRTGIRIFWSVRMVLPHRMMTDAVHSLKQRLQVLNTAWKIIFRSWATAIGALLIIMNGSQDMTCSLAWLDWTEKHRQENRIRVCFCLAHT